MNQIVSIQPSHIVTDDRYLVVKHGGNISAYPCEVGKEQEVMDWLYESYKKIGSISKVHILGKGLTSQQVEKIMADAAKGKEVIKVVL